MAHCVVPIQIAVGVEGGIVWLVKWGKRPVHAAVVLGVGLGQDRGAITLRIVLLLRLRLVLVSAAITACCWRQRLLACAVLAHEQFIVLALGKAVAPGITVARVGAIFAIVHGPCGPAVVGVVIGMARARVRDARVVIVLPVAVVRHGSVSLQRIRQTRWIVQTVDVDSFTRLRGGRSWPGPSS